MKIVKITDSIFTVVLEDNEVELKSKMVKACKDIKKEYDDSMEMKPYPSTGCYISDNCSLKGCYRYHICDFKKSDSLK